MSKAAVMIGDAKEKIKKGVQAYLMKGEDGGYIIPRVNRIPFYLYGKPGIGKTQMTRQIAEELGIGFVSFSLTHHTRNSLLGLPVISELAESKYTEYTMSEVVAEVVKAVQRGQREGILLLDEFNCASDTIMPAMLGFLQTGTIGMHSLPEGWVFILCGNPPEYNRSAREFDAAVMDRLRVMYVDADYEDFAGYASDTGLHPIVQEYLAQNHGDLYQVRRLKRETEDGKSTDELEVVTPRGWENVSWLIKSYEQMGWDIDEETVRGYLKSEEIAYDFYQFYWLNAQSFTVENAEEILQGINLDTYAAQMAGKTLSFRWKVTEFLGQCLEQQAKDGVENEVVSAGIGHAFRLLNMLPEGGKLSEKLLMQINACRELLNVLLEVKCEEYLALCSRTYGIETEQKSA